jgi:hypothetical protein
LTPDKIRDLIGPGRFPSLQAAALAAIAKPGYGEELRNLGAQVFKSVGGELYVHVPANVEPQFWKLVHAAVGRASEEASVKDDFVGGLPYSRAQYEVAGKLHRAGKLTVRSLEARSGLKRKRAHRLHRQFAAGAVLYEDGVLRPGRSHRWDPAGLEKAPPEYKLLPR